MILAIILMVCGLISNCDHYKILPCVVITLAWMAVGILLFCIVPAWCVVSIACYLCGVPACLKMVLAVAGLIDVFYEFGAVRNHKKISAISKEV